MLIRETQFSPEVSQLDRCARICGNNGSCFSQNVKQLRCISDLLINKLWGIRDITEEVIKENRCESLSELLDMVQKNTNELIDWAQLLQIEHQIHVTIDKWHKENGNKHASL